MSVAIDVEDVRRAAATIAGSVVDTPCLPSQTLSDALGASIVLKFENLQFTASFKERGALNKLASLSAEQKRAGVLAVSAGNHAQGVAYHARRLGIGATIVMPATASPVKIERVRDFGAEIILAGKSFSEASERVPDLVASRGLIFVDPFDDPAVIAGQGTVGLEMMAAAPELEVLVVPVGGGGLISGIAVAAKAANPAIEIIGVQSALFPGMAAALGESAEVKGGSSIADGIAVKRPGGMTSAIVRRTVSRILSVDETAIEDAVSALLEIEKTVCEGAGAAGIAAIAANPSLFKGRRVGVVLSGGNIDISVLSSVLQRALVRRGRLMRVSVTTPDIAGALAEIASAIARSGGNIRDVAHERVFTTSGARDTTVTFEVELQDPKGRDRMRSEIEALGMVAEFRPADIDR